ncbi:right-handed parallel beta-helix repeat-containing protein, partial [Candidatus Micrarchaeota archaeon]|nr:right-handed parallel beta-helix repeat-containing protein [Candidatus Micrarchaeota archaeon]
MNKMLFVFVVLLVMMVSVHGQQETFKISVHKGWNLISFPVEKVTNLNFNGAKLYKLNTVETMTNKMYSNVKNGYVPVKNEEIEAGTGYWAFSNKDTVITFSGVPLNSIKLSLRKGQPAYIGGPNCEVETKLTKLRLYYYDPSSNRYVETDKMEPGIGYYVKPEDDGEVLLTCSEEEEECVDLNDPSTWVDSDDPSHPYIREVHASDMDGYMVMKSLTLCPYEYNIESDGLIITQNNVNLDCNNATLIGDGDWTLSRPDRGIFGYRNPGAGGLQNITIKNCNIENFADGIIIIAGHNITINNTLINNSFYSGIEISQSEHVTVANTEIVNASEQFGIFIHDSNHVSISNSSSHDSYSGVSIQDSVYSMILNSSFNNNRMYGIHLRPHGHAITNVTACNNGLDVQEPGDTIITNLQCDTSSPDGICDIPCCTLNP